MKTIKFNNNEITAYKSMNDAWENSISNGFWGSGCLLTLNGWFICLSENNENFEHIMNQGWKLI